MAISGYVDRNGDFKNVNAPNLNLDVKSYSDAVGKVQGAKYDDYLKHDKETNLNKQVFDHADSVMNQYALKGKAGITADFYTKFSDAFDQYKDVIKKDLDKLETDVNIKQAFSGTDIENAVKRLIKAVKEEAFDYLFRLEQAEKTVINSVQTAFQKQQSNMGSSMNSDTAILSAGNASAETKASFASQSSAWGGTSATGSSK